MDEAKIPAFVEITFYFIRDNAGGEDYRMTFGNWCFGEKSEQGRERGMRGREEGGDTFKQGQEIVDLKEE